MQPCRKDTIAQAMAKYPSVETVFVDSAYAGQCAQSVSQVHGIQVQVVRHPANKNVGRWAHPEQSDLFAVQADATDFVVLPKRWVVETYPRLERARTASGHAP
jgi:hypothetical protein